MSKVYNSRFWVTLVALAVPLVNHALGWELNPENMAYIAGIVAAFVLGESWRKAKLVPPAPPQIPGHPPIPTP